MRAAKQPATKLSIVGVLLAVLAAIFYPRGDDAGGASGAPATIPATGSASTVSNEAERAAVAKGRGAPVAAPAGTAVAEPETAGSAAAQRGALPASSSKVGWTSRASLEQHFQKHGAEFGGITIDQYLARAKALRDAALSADVLEVVRADGVITRFHKSSGGFLAYHADKTIRTFFRPEDGEAYFRRQAER